MEQGEKDRRWYAEVRRSEECLCGRPKKGGNAFCWACWSQLPEEMQGGLYRGIGQGYEEAFEVAVSWLQLTVWEEGYR